MNLRRLRDLARFLREQEQLFAISISTVLVMAGQGVIGPVLPLFAKELGVGAGEIGLTLSIFALARLILNVPLGVLSDRFGRRILLVGGPLVTGIGMIGSGFAGDLFSLLAWRFVAGAGSAMYMTGAMVYLTDISTPENRARFIGTNQGALLIGVSIGPAIGGLIAEFFGLRAPFYFVGVCALGAMAYSYFRIPETVGQGLERAARETAERDAEAVGPPAPGRAWVRMLRSKEFVLISFVTMTIFFTRTASRQTLIPLLADERLGMSPGVLGAVFMGMSLINVVLLTPSALAADSFGRKAVIVPSMIATGIALLLYAAATGYPMFLFASVAISVAMSLSGPAPAAYAADIAPPDARGLAMGLYRSTGDIGFVIGPPLLGWIADQSSFSVALSFNAALAVLAGVLFIFARETVRRPAREAVPELRPVEGGDR